MLGQLPADVRADAQVGHKSVSASSRTLEELYLGALTFILLWPPGAPPLTSSTQTRCWKSSSCRTPRRLSPRATRRLLSPSKPRSLLVGESRQCSRSFLCSGVFDYDPAQSLQLLLDHKTDGPTTHAAVLDALSHFRSLDLLTTFNATSSTLTTRPLTVTCTGNCDLASVTAQWPLRDVFLDAPLDDIANPAYTSDVSLMASTSFKRMFGWIDSFDVGADKAVKIGELVRVARDKGIKTRFWETPRCVARTL